MIYYLRTHSDIGFAASKVRQFMLSPGQEHFEATYRILKCLKGTCGKGLLFKRHGQVHVEVFTDVDWAEALLAGNLPQAIVHVLEEFWLFGGAKNIM